MSRPRRGTPGWAQARAVLEVALDECGVDPARQQIGRLHFLGKGLTYRAWLAACAWPSDRGEEMARVVVRLPHGDAGPGQPEAVRRESRLLQRLIAEAFPLRLPEPLATVEVATGVAVVQRYVDGWPLELRAGRNPLVVPWQAVARTAACCHDFLPGPLCELVPGHDTRRDHARAEIAVLGRPDIPELRDAHAWAMAHLPPDTPSRLLHGDLLGQNLLVDIDDPTSLGLIDWEFARRGDPAYDLAIVTRGARQPFHTRGGLARLLDAYNERARDALNAAEVHLHELCLVGRWYLEEREQRGGANQHTLNQLHNVLRRAHQASHRVEST